MATDREKERDAEVESALYTNCLLLGLDPAVLGAAAGGAVPRAGHFRHSNPKLGEQLLYFLLSTLRGPHQSAKDFDKVWPIFDSAQSRDFRKTVQGIIHELESQGALPRSNSRVSSLATCSGSRFIELLWQLSVHTLREVHKRTFPADVASNPLPASLTEVSYLHAAALLPVTKSRIALERRKFQKNANTAVQRQITWSNLAHEMTAEFRSLCAEEAYLQQELEKLQDMRNKAKVEGELWDDRVSGSSMQNSHLVSKATRLWESLLARESQHEVLASGPIEDLIAHREHRYRISGSSLLAAMDLSSHSAQLDIKPTHSCETSPPLDNRDKMDHPQYPGNTDSLSRVDDRGGKVHSTVDVAEILRRWTHALQRVHKQSLHLAKANDGEGPELLRYATDTGTSGHAESLAATLTEHRQHLVSIQGLINQLKEAIPTVQKSISELMEEVNSISSLPVGGYSSRSNSSIEAQISGRSIETTGAELSVSTSNISSFQLEKVPSTALKLPHLFSLSLNSPGKGMHAQKKHNTVPSEPNHIDFFPGGKSIDPPFIGDDADGISQGITDVDTFDVQNLKKSVREAALLKPMKRLSSMEKILYDSSGHFMPLSGGPLRKDIDTATNIRKQWAAFSPRGLPIKGGIVDGSHRDNGQLNAVNSYGFDKYRNQINGDSHLVSSLNYPNSLTAFSDIYEPLDKAFSPPLLMESSLFPDIYEDLLAPLSEMDNALIDG